jgi:hypothetical protein
VTRLEQTAHAERRVRLTTWDGVSEDFDGVVLAVGANVARSLLGRGGTSSHWEQFLLQLVQYGEMVEMILHTDRSFLPAARRHWRSFHFRYHDSSYTRDSDYAFHGLMSRSPPIHGFDEDASPLPILSTNPERPIPEDKVLDRQRWDHMQGDIFLLMLTLVGFVDSIQGNQGVAFAGEWSGGLIGHEMAMVSGRNALAWLGMTDTDVAARSQCESSPTYGQSSRFPVLAHCPPSAQLNDADVCLLADRQHVLQKCSNNTIYACNSSFLRPTSPKVHDVEPGKYFVVFRVCFWMVVVCAGMSFLGLAFGVTAILRPGCQECKRCVRPEDKVNEDRKAIHV